MKSGKRKTICNIRTLVVLFILLVFAAGCQKEPPPIKIGFVADLTGRITTPGVGARNGVMMAVDDINAGGGIHGRKIELNIKDDRFDPQIARKVDQFLIGEGVAAIVGHIHSRMSLAAVPVANRAKVVMLSPISATNQLTGLDDYFFRINSSVRLPSIETARQAYQRGLRKMKGLYDLANKSYAHDTYLDFKEVFESLGGRMLPPQTFSSNTDVSLPDLAKALTSGDPDGYFIVAAPRDNAMICQHIRKIDPLRPIMVSAWANDPVFIQNGGTAVEGVIFSHAFNRNSREPAFLKFKEDFFKRYKTMPGFWETYGYEAIMVLAQALSRNPDSKKLKSTLLEISRFKGLQGDILFDQYGDNHRKPLSFIVKNGAFVEIR